MIKVYQNAPGERKIILTTEKDAMKLELHKESLKAANIPVFILPAKVKFHFGEGSDFDESVKKLLLDFEV